MTKKLIVLIIASDTGLGAKLAQLLQADNEHSVVSRICETTSQDPIESDIATLREGLKIAPVSRPYIPGQKTITRTDRLQRQRLHGRRTGRR